MVDSIPQFDNVRRNKAIMERVLNGAEYEDGVDLFKGNKLKPISVEKS